MRQKRPKEDKPPTKTAPILKFEIKTTDPKTLKLGIGGGTRRSWPVGGRISKGVN